MKKLRKPTTLEIAIGLMIYMIQSMIWNRKVVIPKKIGKYRLLYEVTKENPNRHYAIGIYQFKMQKVFVKTWTGKIKDYMYYDLVNEYIVNKLTYGKLKSRRIFIPKIISYIQYNNSLSIVSEYIEGRTLSYFPLDKKIEVISSVLNAYIDISKSLTEKEKLSFSRRDRSYYIFFLPFLTILTITSNIKSVGVILKAYLSFLKSIKSVKDKDLFIAHRDLCLDNIIVNKSGIFLIDYGRTVLTVRGYDIAFINIRSERRLSKIISEKFQYLSDQFLTNYMLIHLGMSYGVPEGHKNIYLQRLYEKHR